MNRIFRKLLDNKWYLLLSLIVLMLVYKGYTTYAQYSVFLQTPITFEKQEIEYTVKPGASMRHVAKDLVDIGLIEQASFLVVRARMRDLAQSIKVGEFIIKNGMRPDQLLDLLVKGKVKQYSLTLIEGWTFKEVMQAVNSHPQLLHTLIEKKNAEIMTAIGQDGVHPEGWFYPDTYRFPANTTDVEFLKRANRHMHNYVNEQWKGRDSNLPIKTPYEALILASIIEKETAQQVEYGQIAGVFIRRLNKGIRLQTDPTVIYGLGDKFNGNLKRKHLRQDTPYNTYTRKGLPPTPIALPGGQAIYSALHPADGKTLYFVAKGNGMHQFSKTLKEHNEAVIRYQLKGNRNKAFSSKPVVTKK